MKPLIIILTLICCYSSTFAQTDLPERKNLIFVEGGGALAAGVGLGYERYLAMNELSRFTARGGGGLIEHFSSPSFFVGSSFMYGKSFRQK